MKSLSETTFSNVEINVKGNKISVKQDDEIQVSNLNFEGSNLIQNGGEYQNGESNSQLKYLSQRQQMIMTNRLKMISQNSIVLKQAGEFPNELKVDNNSIASRRRSCKQTSLQVIPRVGQQENLKSSMQGLYRGNNNGKEHRQSQPVMIQLNLKLLSKMKRQMVYFYQVFTDRGRRLLFEDKKVRESIDDKCDVFEDRRRICFQYLYFIRQHLSELLQKLQKIPLINPDGVPYFLMIFAFCIYNTLFYIMYTLFGVFQAPRECGDILDKVTVGVWVLEITLRLNTGVYINKSTLSSNRKQIWGFYFRKHFFFDIIPLIVLLVVHNQQQVAHIFLKLIMCLKFKILLQDIELVQKFMVMSFQNFYIIQLVNLIIKLFIIAHTIACFWYIIGMLEFNYLGEETTWFDSGIGSDGTWWKIYQEALFWSLTLMTTGSNVATTSLQLFFTSFIMLFTTIIFGYMLNVIGIILEELDTKDENKRRDLNVINQYMRQKKISKNLQKKVNNDIEYFYEKNFKKFEEDSEQVLGKISKELNDQLLQEYNKQIISQIPILKNNFSQEALNGLYHSFEEVIYFPNQIIQMQQQSQQDNEENYLIFILQGQGKRILFNIPNVTKLWGKKMLIKSKSSLYFF